MSNFLNAKDVEELQYEIRRLKRENENLKEDVNRLRDNFDSAQFRIDTELEPRIQREKRSYDDWATNPER